MTIKVRNVVVVGSGVGGLASAIRLAAAGLRVTVCERAPSVGGKLRQIAVGSCRVDVGPTVVTMPHVIRDLFASAGQRLEDHLQLAPLSPACRHFFADGSRLDLWNDPDRSREAIRAFAGEAEARGFDRLRRHGALIHSVVRAPFMESAAPTSVLGMLRPSLWPHLPGMLRIDAGRSLWKALSGFFSDERLRVLFGRYATYNGSSPFHAPATLSVIAHVEQAFGVYAVVGGIRRLAEALGEVARGLGVELRTSCEVERILVEEGRVTGVRVAGGETLAAEAVVANCEALHLYRALLPPTPRAAREARRIEALEPSLSAFLLAAVADVGDFPLAHHNVFFSADYRREFDELIAERRPPTDATIYLCAGDRTDASADEAGEIGRNVAATAPTGPQTREPGGALERHLLLMNAPSIDISADGARAIDWTQEKGPCRNRMIEALRRHGLAFAPAAEALVTPEDLEALFPSSRGAIYGASSNAKTAAFERPANRVAGWKGLYLVGGSAHPGAGVPMVMLSAKIATTAALRDLGIAAPPSRADTPGGTSTP